MTSELNIFEQSDFGAVRIINVDGEPWFVAKDIAQALGYSEESNAARLFSRVPEEWKGVKQIHTIKGMQEMTMLSEQGLYFFLGRSDKPKALPFQKWIAGDILPTIRKTGCYGMPKTYPDALRAWAAEIELREAIEQQRALAEAQRDEAIRTKAEIGSRREATAMATASVAIRKVNALEDKLGMGKNYKQVKAIPWLGEFFLLTKKVYPQIGKKLTAISKRMKYEMLEVLSSEYPNGVKAYHIDVIASFRAELERDLKMLGKYRRADV